MLGKNDLATCLELSNVILGKVTENFLKRRGFRHGNFSQ
jgi:hypothetical protein